MVETATTTIIAQNRSMQSYYRIHAALYDATRWTFLFGRKRLVRHLPFKPEDAFTLLEVGCGTGYNLVQLAGRFQNARLIGVDISPDMLKRATRRTTPCSQRVFLFEKPYAPGSFQLKMQPDIVLCSYALTMFNPGWEDAVRRAWEDLPAGGYIAVVDFHDTPSRLFRWWMGKNHVRMEAHLLPVLKQYFIPVMQEIHPAAAGLWDYVLFIGRKP